MSLRVRILLGFLLIYTAGFYFLGDSIVKDMRPRYLEAVEESLNDTAHVLAALVELDLMNGRPDPSRIRRLFANLRGRRLSAKIFGYRKTGVDLHAYVTDERGLVLFDSRGPENTGKDFSLWNDVRRTLKGRYGARSTRTDRKDPASSLLYVSAPVRNGRSIAGVVTVIKPQDSVTPFIQIAERKLLLFLLWLGAALAVLSLGLTLWVSRPLSRLTQYVLSLKENPDARPPRLSGREARALGRAFEELLNKLRGKEYIENYVRNLTHELKSPLTSLRASAELLEQDMPEDQRLRFLGNIQLETRQMDDIIRKMLELSELENRSGPVNVEEIPVVDLAANGCEGSRLILMKKNINLIKKTAPGLRVRGERLLLERAVANLVENAVRFTPEGGTITLNAERSGSELSLSVSDTGTGIPPYAEGKIFDKFYSLPDPGSRKKSTGLGLPFVREVALLHRGSLEVKNNEGPGVTAFIRLPL